MPTLEQHKQAYARAMAAGDTLAAYKIKNIIEDEQEAKTKAAQQSVQGLDTDITPQPESTLMERVGEVVQRRGAGIGETLSRPLDLGLPQEGALGVGDKLVRTLGDVAGGVGEIAGDAIMTGISYLTPDLAKEAVDDAFNYVSQTEAGKEGLRLATLSADKYKGWADANPDDAKLLESYFNIGAFLTPATKIKAPVLDVAETLEDTGGNLVKSGRSKIRGEERDIITAMLEPDAKHLTGEDFEVSEITQKITYNPQSPYTQETIDIVTDSGIVKPKKTYTYNSKKLGEAAKRERNILEARLAREDVILNKANVLREIETKAQQFLDEAQRTIGDETKLKQVNSIFGEAVRQVQNSDGSLLGLLEARRGVDKFTRSYDGKVDFTTQNSLATASRSVRNAMNEILEREAKNTEVARSLRKQAAFLDAAKILNKKISKDGRTVFARLAKVAGNYMPRTPLAQAATASAAAGLATQYWPLMTLGAVTGLVYGGGKAALSGEARELLGKIIADTGTAIKKAEKMGHLDAVEQMKADRLVLVSLLNESPTEEPED
jgi:hypothetical protein